MIPKEINYIFGIDDDFCKKPFCYFHYLNVLSAKLINNDYQINVFYGYYPQNTYFTKLSDFCSLKKIDKSILGRLKNRNFKYKEHMVDLLRLELLYQNGGIYLDIDTICVKAFDDLLNNVCVMGEEYGKHPHQEKKELIGLCNAVILSDKNSSFIRLMLDSFHEDYRPNWNYNCVVKPYQIYVKFPELINVQPQSSFFKYSWDIDGRKSLFENSENTDDCYSIHLWESKNYEILKTYDLHTIRSTNNTACNTYKRFLEYYT